MLELATVAAFAVGLIIGGFAVALMIPRAKRGARVTADAELAARDAALAELRSEQAEDRETNRRLRHELATSTPDQLRAARADTDRLRRELDDRDRSLREARLAVQDIRRALEDGRLVPGTAEPVSTSGNGIDLSMLESAGEHDADPVGDDGAVPPGMFFDDYPLNEPSASS